MKALPTVLFPIVYYYRGRVREEMKTTNFADSYREYPEDPRRIQRRPTRAGCPQARRELTQLPRGAPDDTLPAPVLAMRRTWSCAGILGPEIKLRVGRERASPARTDWSGRCSPIVVETGAIDKAQTLAAALSTSTEPSDDSRVYGKRPAPHTSH